MLKPFLLRRIKSDVETSLPAKKEIILYSHMTDLQKKYNQDLRDRTLNVSQPLDSACVDSIRSRLPNKTVKEAVSLLCGSTRQNRGRSLELHGDKEEVHCFCLFQSLELEWRICFRCPTPSPRNLAETALEQDRPRS